LDQAPAKKHVSPDLPNVRQNLIEVDKQNKALLEKEKRYYNEKEKQTKIQRKIR
jgi:hypothetical protein